MEPLDLVAEASYSGIGQGLFSDSTEDGSSRDPSNEGRGPKEAPIVEEKDEDSSGNFIAIGNTAEVIARLGCSPIAQVIGGKAKGVLQF